MKLTLKMIEKYKKYFGIKKIVLSDTSVYKCITNESIDMAIMKTLLTGDTWYGGYGFRPFNKDTYELDKYQNKKYQENKEIMNKLLLKDINIEKYLLKIHKKFPKEFTKQMIKEIINREKGKPEKLSFLTHFTKNYLMILA